MTETSVHTEGPWKLGNGDIFAEGNKGSDFDDRVICAIGQSGGFRSHEYVAIRAHKPEGKANARLIVAACNSYDRHFGTRAVEAAEGDLLGKALEALRELADSLEIDCQCPPCEGSDAPAEHWLGVARRILSQAQAREVTR